GSAAPADRVPLEELPHDGHGGSREREDQAARPRELRQRRMARILLGVTGGIAAYKACTLVRLLVRAGHEVHPVLTAGAERFVTAETFAALARRVPSDDPFPPLGRFALLGV